MRWLSNNPDCPQNEWVHLYRRGNVGGRVKQGDAGCDPNVAVVRTFTSVHRRGKVVRILPSSTSLLENKTEESLIPNRMSKQMRSLLKKIAVASVHSSEPIIMKEDGCHVEQEEAETSVVPVRQSNWDHVTVWSVDNTCVRTCSLIFP